MARWAEDFGAAGFHDRGGGGFGTTARPSASTAMSDFPAVIDLATLDGTNGFRLEGIDKNDYSGWSVSSAGDVNSDGFDDVIIGAPARNPGGRNEGGESYVVFGKADGFAASIDLSTLDGINGFRLEGVGKGGHNGVSVSSAGDVNGDGVDDFIIGANESVAPIATHRAGEGYVVFGNPAGFAATFDLASLDGTNGFRLDGIDILDHAGRSVSSAGDVNGDGFDDIIIGAEWADADSDDDIRCGESYVVFGKAGGFAANLDLATLDGTNGFRLAGIDASDYSGWSVSSAGDVNGDGFDDIVIGARRGDPDGKDSAGESYVVFGKAGGFAASLDLATLDGSNGFRLDGVDALDQSGYSVSDAGDFNGDGFDDIVIGAHLADPGGEGYVLFGRAGGFAASVNLAALDGTNGFRVIGAGFSVSSAGDVNGDGFDDIIFGTPGADPGGASYVVFGKAGGFGASLDLTTLDGTNGFRVDGVDAGDGSGRSVSAAGDVNGDGFDDIIIGASKAGPGGRNNAHGESYVIFGVAPTEAVTRIGSAADQTIRGGDFDDALFGEGGDDRLAGGGGGDVLDGGTGRDRADYDTADAGVRASLSAPGNNTGEAAGDTYISIENLQGSDFNDRLAGDSLANRIEGRAGADSLDGRNGDDRLAGEAGHDSLKGGKGADRFEFASLSADDSDMIGDFASGVDKIALEGDVFGFAGGALPPGSFVTGGAAQDANDRLIYNAANGQLFFDADGTGAGAQVLIATLTGAPVITASDFVVI